MFKQPFVYLQISFVSLSNVSTLCGAEEILNKAARWARFILTCLDGEAVILVIVLVVACVGYKQCTSFSRSSSTSRLKIMGVSNANNKSMK